MNNTLMNEFVSLFQKMMAEASKNTTPLSKSNTESTGSDILIGNSVSNNTPVSNLSTNYPEPQSGINIIPIIKKDVTKDAPKISVTPKLSKAEVKETVDNVNKINTVPVPPPMPPKPDEILNMKVLETKSRLADVLLQRLGFSDTTVETLVKQNKVDKVLEKANELYVKPKVIIHAYEYDGKDEYTSLSRYLYESDDSKVNESIVDLLTSLLNLDEDDEIPSWAIKPTVCSANLSVVKVGGATIHIFYMEPKV